MVSSARPEKWKGVGQDAGQRLQVPRQPAEKECRHLLAGGARHSSGGTGAAACPGRAGVAGGADPEDDNESQREQIAFLDNRLRAGGGSNFAHMGVIICLARKPMSSAEPQDCPRKLRRKALFSEVDLTFVNRRIQSTKTGRSKILGCVVDCPKPSPDLLPGRAE